MLFVDMFWCVNDSYLAKVLSSVLQIASSLQWLQHNLFGQLDRKSYVYFFYTDRLSSYRTIPAEKGSYCFITRSLSNEKLERNSKIPLSQHHFISCMY